MNEALEDEDFKDIYVLLDLRSNRFKDMRWDVKQVYQDFALLICKCSKWDSMEFNTTG